MEKSLAQRLVCRVALGGVGVMVLLCCGCTGLREWIHNGFKVGPNYHKPAAPVAPEWIETAAPGVNSVCPDLRDWWLVFDDPVLNELIKTAHQQNLDVRIAGARVLEARAMRNVALGGLFPQLQNATASYQRNAISRTTAQTKFITRFQNFSIPGLPVLFPFPAFFDQWSAGFNLSWELDFWGRFRRAIEAGDANFDASIENYDAALVTLIADVATNYIELRTFQERIRFADKNIAIQDELVKKAELRLDVGQAGKLDLAQMRSNLTDTLALKESLQNGLRQANNRLCVLLGMPVRDLTRELGEGPVPIAPLEVVVGVPADLLRRRPDVRSAERQVAAASAQIGVAMSDLYPHISIIGTLGWQSETLSKMLGPQSLNGNIGPSIQWNILNYGRILNNVRAQDARFQQAIYSYQKTVLTAGREAEDGMIEFLTAKRRALQLTDSARNAETAVEVVEDLIKLKNFDVNRIFVTTNFLTQQQDKLAQARGDIALGLIQVYRALGGGWQIRLPDSPVTASCPTPADASSTTSAPAFEVLPALRPPPADHWMISAMP
jgi:NodT family efflux transporter outer membrane factor (OMF) lipoprotein